MQQRMLIVTVVNKGVSVHIGLSSGQCVAFKRPLEKGRGTKAWAGRVNGTIHEYLIK